MVASIPTPTPTSNPTAIKMKHAKTKLKMETTATLEELFSFPVASLHAGTLDPQVLLDEWLANDLQQTGFLSEGNCSPDVGSPVTDFDASSLFGSPTPDGASMSSSTTSPVLDDVMNLFPELVNFTIPSVPVILSANAWSPPAIKASPPTQSPRIAPIPLAAKPKTLKRAVSVDSDAPDDLNVKRQRNTDAARRSRLKKVMRMESLEQRVAELEADNTRLVLRAAVLESEKAGLAAREKDQESRVARLEAQLAEAHRALTRGDR